MASTVDKLKLNTYVSTFAEVNITFYLVLCQIFVNRDSTKIDQ